MSEEQPGPERRLVVDRLEADLVVVEVDGGATVDLPSWLLPPGVKEGDVVRVRTVVEGESDRRVVVAVDAEQTRAARQSAVERLERLRARDPGGDIAL